MAPLFGITLDEWAISEDTTIITMTIQSICLLLTLSLIISRICHIKKDWKELKSNWKFALLLFLQLFMMIFSFLYIFFDFWNYIHLYLSSNSIDCDAWWHLLGVFFSFTRILLFAFVMLRTSLLFENTFWELSLKITIPLVIFNTLFDIIFVPLVLSDSFGFQPIPVKGFCFRFIGEFGLMIGTASHLFNAATSTVAVVIFYWKARLVSKSIAELQKDNKMNDSLRELNVSFMKHIKLGIITIAGTIIIFFIQGLFTVLLGISFTLDQTVNNILTCLMFKEYNIIYKYLCCKCLQRKANDDINVVNLANIISNTSHSSQSTPPTTAASTTHSIQAVGSNVVAIIH